jgi:hypothetical protein
MGFQFKTPSLGLLLALLVNVAAHSSAGAQSPAMKQSVGNGAGTPTLARSTGHQPAPARPVRRSPVRTASAVEPVESNLAPTVVHGHSVYQPPNSILVDDSAVANSSLASCDSCGSDFCCSNPSGYLFDWSRADLWAGTAGFVGPSNFITSGANANGAVEGSFGFQEGINFGSRLPSLLSGQMGAQLGARFIQSHLDGSAAGTDNRQQAFATAGLFRRVDYGLQAGLVVDFLHDDWIYKADYLQLRGEASFLFSPCHDFGFRFTDSQRSDSVTAKLAGSTTSTTLDLAALNTYRFFYRYRYGERSRGQAEIQAGWTEDSGTVLGVDLKTPLQNQLGLMTSATYLLPPAGASPGFASEGWNLSIAIAWTPGRCFGLARDYYRPLFDVADNGSLLTKRGN